jgi:hypothetical protein
VIDTVISVEIPDPDDDPLGYILVSEFMMHGPSGELNDKCVCMKRGKMFQAFSKRFSGGDYN